MPILAALAILTAQAAPRADVVVPPGGQVDPFASAKVVGAAQVGDAGRSNVMEQLPVDTAPRPTVAQVAAVPKSAAPQSQITHERRGVAGAPQLGKAPRSAAAPSSPATRADGRRTEVVRVGGRDRCDGRGDAADPRCQRVIETRSAEFSAPRAPVLSPEQRLLLDQERGETRGVRAAAQRVARNEVDPGALDTQVLAAISLAQQPTDTPTAKLPDPATAVAADAVIQIIEAIQAGTPKP